MASFDVTVRGAGVFGLSVAWSCARRGARVQVIELSRSGAGASGGLVGALAPHVPDAWNPLKQFQLDSLLMAQGWWQAVRKAGGVDPGYLRSGRLQPLADAAAVQTARDRAKAATRLWGASASWQVIPATGQPWEPQSPSGWLVHDTLSARLSPRGACAALVAALTAAGGVLAGPEAAESGAVVHATGAAGLADLSRWFDRPLGGGVKGQAAALRLEMPLAPQVYAGGLHIVPHADGTIAIGSTSETAWTEDGPDAQLDDLIARARLVLPILASARVVDRWAGIRPRAASRQLVLGPWPGRAGHFLANGGFKIGFGMAPKAAETLADLVLDGRDDVPDGFRPETLVGRFA